MMYMHRQNNGLILITSVCKINSRVSKLTYIFVIFSRYQAAHFTIKNQLKTHLYNFCVCNSIPKYVPSNKRLPPYIKPRFDIEIKNLLTLDMTADSFLPIHLVANIGVDDAR